jgi:hypothetical protein
LGASVFLPEVSADLLALRDPSVECGLRLLIITKDWVTFLRQLFILNKNKNRNPTYPKIGRRQSLVHVLE